MKRYSVLMDQQSGGMIDVPDKRGPYVLHADHAAEMDKLAAYAEHDIRCATREVGGHEPGKGYMVWRNGKHEYLEKMPDCTCGLAALLRECGGE